MDHKTFPYSPQEIAEFERAMARVGAQIAAPLAVAAAQATEAMLAAFSQIGMSLSQASAGIEKLAESIRMWQRREGRIRDLRLQVLGTREEFLQRPLVEQYLRVQFLHFALIVERLSPAVGYVTRWTMLRMWWREFMDAQDPLLPEEDGDDVHAAA